MRTPRCGLAILPRSEALPRDTHGRHRRVRAASDDASGHESVVTGAYRESSIPRQTRLPRNLVGLKVVVVDDEDDSREYFATALRTCGASVVTASSAFDALQLVQDERPHVVLSDIAMVGQDGYWLVHQIRRLADQSVSRLPIVATTAYGAEHSRARTFAAGFAEHLAKPVDPDLLCRTIARAAGR